jgi:hypothetical protein
MATARKNAALATIDSTGEMIEAPETMVNEFEDDLPQDFALLGTLAELGESESEAKVMVYRNAKDRGSRDSYIFTCTPAEFSIDTLRNTYGGGEFRIRVIQQGRILKNQVVAVEPKPIETAPDPQAGMNQMMTVMMAGFKQMTEAIAASKPVAAPAGMGVAETISLISALKPMMTNNSAPAAPVADPLDMITKILALQRELGGLSGGGEGKGDDAMTAIILKGMDTFGKPMAEMMAQTQAQKASQAMPAHDVAPLAIAAPVIEPLPEESDMSLKISLIKGAILPMAASNADPFPYANMVLDYFGDDEVERYINAPDWREQLEKLIPEAAQYRPWFEKLRNTAVELLKPEDQPGTVA